MTQNLSDWLQCPECGSEDVTHSYNNGRARVTCEDCLTGTSQLVGRAEFNPK